MFVTDPFAELEATVPPTIIQIYVAAISVQSRWVHSY